MTVNAIAFVTAYKNRVVGGGSKLLPLLQDMMPHVSVVEATECTVPSDANIVICSVLGPRCSRGRTLANKIASERPNTTVILLGNRVTIPVCERNEINPRVVPVIIKSKRTSKISERAAAVHSMIASRLTPAAA